MKSVLKSVLFISFIVWQFCWYSTLTHFWPHSFGGKSSQQFFLTISCLCWVHVWGGLWYSTLMRTATFMVDSSFKAQPKDIKKEVWKYVLKFIKEIKKIPFNLPSLPLTLLYEGKNNCVHLIFLSIRIEALSMISLC
jgi:hypothetical protein